jgi:hypothetical protein
MLATGTLAANRSYAFLPSCDRSQPWDGVLTIIQDTGTRVRRTVTDRYGIEEQPSGSFPGRVFLICKEHHAGDLDTVNGRKSAERCGEVYQCRVSEFEQVVSHCSCPGFVAGRGLRPCKHVLTLQACIEHGAFPDPIGFDPREQGDLGEQYDAQASDPLNEANAPYPFAA